MGEGGWIWGFVGNDLRLSEMVRHGLLSSSSLQDLTACYAGKEEEDDGEVCVSPPRMS